MAGESIRELIIIAAIDALNASGRPVGVPNTERTRTTDLDPETDLPSILIFPSRDTPDVVIGNRSGSRGGVTRKKLSIVLECRAAGTDSLRADEAVDPLYQWVVKTLARRRLDDGAGLILNHDIEEGETTFSYEQGAAPYCLAAVEMIVTYQHLAADPASLV